MTNPAAAVEDPAAWSEQAVPGRYRHDWQLFLDWCTATDRAALPADPGHRDRVPRRPPRHPRHEPPAPHRDPLDPPARPRTRAAPHHGAAVTCPPAHRQDGIDAETIRPLLEQMPTSGWTAGLVGRRDALLLVLAAHGVPYAAIERLHRRDVAVDENRCLVVTLPNSVVRIPAAPADPRTCPVAVYLRWARLLAYHDRYPSATALEKALRAAQPIGADTIERYQPLPEPSRDGRDPLLPTIDRWGQFGTPRGSRRERWGMDADSAAKIVRAHLAGEAVPRYLEEKAETPRRRRRGSREGPWRHPAVAAGTQRWRRSQTQGHPATVRSRRQLRRDRTPSRRSGGLGCIADRRECSCPEWATTRAE